jgi:hypothetical protein
LNPTTEHLHKVIEQIEERRRQTADPAKSLQSADKPEPDARPGADGDPADKPWRCSEPV